MKRILFSFFAVALTAGTSSASPVTYTYDWSSSIGSVAADSGPNVINFTNAPVQTGIGSTGLIGSNPIVGTNDPGIWTNRAVAFKVVVNDGGFTHSELFNGKVAGAVSGSSSTLMLTLTDPSLDRIFFLNGDKFELVMNGSTPIPVHSSPTIAALGGTMTVNGGNGGQPGGPPGGGTKDTPEPSTILLSALGLGGLGLRAWRKRKLVTA